MHSPHAADRREWITWGLVLIVQGVVARWEWLGSQQSHSLALLSDMLHNANDVLLIILTGVPAYALIFSSNQQPPRWTAAWRRLALIINVAALMGSGLYSIQLGVQHLRYANRVVDYHHAWPIAFASLLANLFIYLVLRPHHHHHDVRAFGWHQLWDIVSALAAAVLLWTGTRVVFPQLDAAISVLIGVAMTLHWPVTVLAERNGHRSQ